LLISVDDAVARLSKGDIVALPSETVYGLAGLALETKSVEAIYAYKDRPSTNPLIVHICSVKAAEKLAHFSPDAYKAAESFWPGPLTLILPKKDCVPDLVTADNPTLALRIPKHPVFLKILQGVEQPLAAPSANPSNRTSPTEAKHLEELFGKQCPPTVDGGKCSVGIESTVLDLTQKTPTILRPGAITRKQIIEKMGMDVQIQQEKVCNHVDKKPQKRMASPGMQSVHYAPKTPLFLYSSIESFQQKKTYEPGDLVVLSNAKKSAHLPKDLRELYTLSEDGNPQTIAQNLYGTLIELDAKKANSIHLIFTENHTGVNRATWDRLSRAQTKWLNHQARWFASTTPLHQVSLAIIQELLFQCKNILTL